MQSQNTQGVRTHEGFSADDAGSITAVLTMLEEQAIKLGSASKVRALWRDWSDLLEPASVGATDRALDLVLDQVTPGGLPQEQPRDGLACAKCGGLDGPMIPVPGTGRQQFVHWPCPG